MHADSARRSRVVVVGGGIIGLSVAWRIAQRCDGIDTVTVVDPAPASGASHVAAGMLAPVTELHFGEEALLRLNLASAQRWPTFAAELAEATGMPVDFERGGTLAVAYDNDDRAALAVLHDYLRRLTLPATWKRASEARVAEPMLAPSIRGALEAEADHRVDPRSVTAALLVACESAGVQFVRDQVARIETSCSAPPGEVAAVTLADAKSTALPADLVVLAAGAASQLIDGIPDEDRPPVRPVKGQLLIVRGPTAPPLLTRAVRGSVRGSAVYLVPRPDGRIIVGATVEEQGWDARPTVDATYTLLRDATALLPGLSECELLDTLVGFRPGTPDNAPIIGFGQTAGLVHATGHYRNGVLLTPATADAVAELVATGRTPNVIASFANSRFASNETGTERIAEAALR